MARLALYAAIITGVALLATSSAHAASPRAAVRAWRVAHDT